MYGGSEDQREHHGTENAADDGDGERLEHGRTGTDAESQRKHSGNRGESGHGNGTQAATAGLNHGVFTGVAKTAKTLLGIEEQDAVLGDDANDHNHAHEGSDVKCRARDEKSEKTAEAGKERGGKNGGWRRESAEFQKENGKQEHQRQEEHHQQVIEGFLLLLI